MKTKNIFVLLLVTVFCLPRVTSAQEPPWKKKHIAVADRKVLYGFSFLGDFREHGGVKFTFHVRNTVKQWGIANPYIGFGLAQRAILTEGGFRLPLRSTTCCDPRFRPQFVVGLTWKYRADVQADHDQLIYETWKHPGKMVLAFQLGPAIEYGRFGITLQFHPGVSWWPKRDYDWKDNWYWYWGGEFGIYFLIHEEEFDSEFESQFIQIQTAWADHPPGFFIATSEERVNEYSHSRRPMIQ